MNVRIEAVTSSSSEDWYRMRCALWPESGEEKHRQEIRDFFADQVAEPAAVFLARSDEGYGVGMVELSIRAYAEGCEQANPAYVEGIFVESVWRRQGIARQLMNAAEDWARQNGCSELASDSLPDNSPSAELHAASGFRDAGLIRCWIKPLK